MEDGRESGAETPDERSPQAAWWADILSRLAPAVRQQVRLLGESIGAVMKAFPKVAAEGVATLLVVPAVLLYLLGRLVFGRQKAFPGWSQVFSLLPGLCGVYLRRAFYRLVLERCGGGSWIGFGTVFSHPTAAVGRNVYVGNYCCLGDVTLEDEVLLGSQISIMNGGAQHGIERLDVPIREQPGSWPHITIGRDSWVGDRAVVLANVGKHCVIGAGSVVTKDIPDYGIAVGVPAKVIRFRKDPPTAFAEKPTLAAVGSTPRNGQSL
jgi:acetyltransferase-like isoleucine patch superfamily enzyme